MAIQNVKKITSYLFVLRLFRMSLSMISLILSAKFFGVSVEKDIWVLITTFLLTFGAAIWGPVNETFRAKFVFIKEQEGEAKAIVSTLSLVVCIVSITIVLSIIIALLRNSLAAWLFTTSTSDESLHLFSLLLILMLPTLLINQLSSIGISILNAYNIYYLPEIIGVISSVINVAIIFFLAPRIGIFSLAISQYIALILLLLGVSYYLWRLRLFHWSDILNVRLHGFWVFLLFALPFFFPYFVGQCNAFVEKWLAGCLGEGIISSLDYARQFTVVLQSVISSVLTTVMVPLLAKAYAQHDMEQYQRIFRENLIVCFGILALAVPIMVGAATPLCNFFFLHGKVSPEALSAIIILTRAYGFAFIGILLYMVVGYALLASDKGKRYAFWGVVVQLIILGMNFVLIHFLGVYVFPLTLGIVHLAGAGVMVISLLLQHKNAIFLRVGRYSLVIIGMSLLLYIFNEIIHMSSAFVQLLFNGLLLFGLLALCAPALDIHLFTYLNKLYLKLCRNS